MIGVTMRCDNRMKTAATPLFDIQSYKPEHLGSFRGTIRNARAPKVNEDVTVVLRLRVAEGEQETVAEAYLVSADQDFFRRLFSGLRRIYHHQFLLWRDWLCQSGVNACE